MKQYIIPFMMAVALLGASCTKHDEVEFAGKVVGISECAGFGTAGYLVQLSYPEGAGKDIVVGDDTLQNVMILYEPAVHIVVQDYVSGTFYYDADYAKVNCHYAKRYDIPEGVFWKIKVADQ